MKNIFNCLTKIVSDFFTGPEPRAQYEVEATWQPDPKDGKFYCYDEFGTHSFTTATKMAAYMNDMDTVAEDMTATEWKDYVQGQQTPLKWPEACIPTPNRPRGTALSHYDRWPWQAPDYYRFECESQFVYEAFRYLNPPPPP